MDGPLVSLILSECIVYNIPLHITIIEIDIRQVLLILTQFLKLFFNFDILNKTEKNVLCYTYIELLSLLYIMILHAKFRHGNDQKINNKNIRRTLNVES